MKNYSKQRAAILNVLHNTKVHPSAAYIYNEVRKELPNISLGTVYRNLSELEKAGQITKIAGNFEKERYDADTTAHAHFICSSCGCIKDYAISDELSANIMRGRKYAKGFILNYLGICEKCSKTKKDVEVKK